MFFRRRGWSPESWYEPRRSSITSTTAVIFGVAGAFYAGATRWSLLSDPDYSFAWSFAKYQAAIALGAAAFALVGGSGGWIAGYLWERWHRSRRVTRDADAQRVARDAPPMPAAQPVVITSASYDSIPNFGRLYDAMPAYAARKDAAFYLDMARRTGGPVLELGCGTGRVLLPIARAEIPIVGVDGSRLMLDRCRERLASEAPDVQERVELHLMDAAALNLGRRFPLITAPFRVLQQLTSTEHQLQFLASVVRHLAPGGWFVFDVFNPNFAALAADRTRESVDTPDFVHEDGRTLRRAFRVPRVRWLDQTMETELIYYVTDPGKPTGRFVQALELRWYTLVELEHLLARAGLRATVVEGDFEHGKLDDKSPEFVIRAELSKQ